MRYVRSYVKLCSGSRIRLCSKSHNLGITFEHLPTKSWVLQSDLITISSASNWNKLNLFASNKLVLFDSKIIYFKSVLIVEKKLLLCKKKGIKTRK